MNRSSLLLLAFQFVIDWSRSDHNVYQCWVRKLNGKPAANTTPDCEFEARRIHLGYEIRVSFWAADSKALRIHSDLLLRDLAIAACIFSASGGVNLAANNSPLAFCMPIFGLPTFFFAIFVNINVDGIVISVNNKCNIK